MLLPSSYWGTSTGTRTSFSIDRCTWRMQGSRRKKMYHTHEYHIQRAACLQTERETRLLSTRTESRQRRIADDGNRPVRLGRPCVRDPLSKNRYRFARTLYHAATLTTKIIVELFPEVLSILSGSETLREQVLKVTTKRAIRYRRNKNSERRCLLSIF